LLRNLLASPYRRHHSIDISCRARWCAAWRGQELSGDPAYQQRLANGKITTPQTAANVQVSQIGNARGSTLLFLAGIALVVLLGMFPQMRPVYQTISNGEVDTDQVAMDLPS
jgi:anaerobic C4-dicarboxylate transporter